MVLLVKGGSLGPEIVKLNYKLSYSTRRHVLPSVQEKDPQ